MPAELVFTTPASSLLGPVFQARSNAVETAKAVQGRNLDVIRAALTRVAANSGVAVDIVPLEASNVQITWSVLFDNMEVARILETGIGKGDRPTVCPSCLKPLAEGSSGTNAHDVVSAALWRRVLDEVFTRWFGNLFTFKLGNMVRELPEPEQRKGLDELKKSLLAVTQGTTRSSYNGAATQGDRRTCKACENLQGAMSLVQRHELVADAAKQPTGPRPEGGVSFFKSVKSREVLHNAYDTSGFDSSTAVVEEITRARVEDVVRGMALELNTTQKYKFFDSDWEHKWVYKPQFAFMGDLEFDGNGYFAFLEDVRATAYKQATGKPLDDAHAQSARAEMIGYAVAAKPHVRRVQKQTKSTH